MYKHLQNLTFESFADLAECPDVDPYERIGFPRAYREGKEQAIFDDIRRKLSNLNLAARVVLEVGPGSGKLPQFLIDQTRETKSTLYFCDSEPVLKHIPEENHIEKINGRFPDCKERLNHLEQKVDVILIYSVFHYVYNYSCPWHFLDCCLNLLAPQGQILIGDIPNQSRRNRFFSSDRGIKYHQDYTRTKEIPCIEWNNFASGTIDDAVLSGMVQRCRLQGFNAYLLPQSKELPFANRREDLFIERD